MSYARLAASLACTDKQRVRLYSCLAETIGDAIAHQPRAKKDPCCDLRTYPRQLRYKHALASDLLASISAGCCLQARPLVRQAGFKPCSALSANLASSSKTRASDALKRRGQSLDSAKDACKENDFVRAATQAGEAPESLLLHICSLCYFSCAAQILSSQQW